MILLCAKHENAPRHIIVWGNGLIGSSIVRRIIGSGNYFAKQMSYTWSSPDQQTLEILALEREIKNNTPPLFDVTSSLQVIWCAGAAGFSCTDETTHGELLNFKRVVTFVEQLQSRTKAQIPFHHFSSAGGLFEGIRHISNTSTPNPARPYGHLKLQQEIALRQTGLHHVIYRPTSVYSFATAGHRCGLIPTLVRCAMFNREATIVGRPDTLRDFVWAGDIANHVYRNVIDSQNATTEGPCELIAAGIPTSLSDVCLRVERVLMRPLRLKHSIKGSNSSDITVKKSSCPPSLKVSSLNENIARIHQQLLMEHSAV